MLFVLKMMDEVHVVYVICLRFVVKVFVSMCVDNACLIVGMRCFIGLHVIIILHSTWV